MKIKIFFSALITSFFFSCKDDPSLPYVRMDQIEVLFTIDNDNALNGDKIDINQFEVMYMRDGKEIPYPYSNEHFPKGFRIIEIEGNKIVTIHLDPSQDNTTTLFRRSSSAIDTIKAEFIKTPTSVQYSKVLYNGVLKIDWKNTPVTSRFIEVELK